MRNAEFLDDIQANVCSNFSESNQLSNEKFVGGVFDWVTFWRRNIGRFAEYYFNMKFHLYQHIIFSLMALCPSCCIVAARADAKSFIIAVFSCAYAILYPGSKIVIASATKKQARLIVSEKIKKEILPNSKLLQSEIESFRDSANETEVLFYNSSSIVVVPATDNARGYRSTIVIYEEFRMIAKNIIDSVLSPFSVVRTCPAYMKEQYSGLIEESKEIYISSSWYRNHWMWPQIKLMAKDMFTKHDTALFSMDYSIALKHNIKTRKFFIKEKSKMDPMTWQIEYENQMIAENLNAYFTYEMLSKNMTITHAFYPRRNDDVISRVKNRFAMAKLPGEVRIVSCDIAFKGGKNNDNSIFSCIRLLPESKEYKHSDKEGEHFELSQGYRRQVVYMECMKEFETVKQAIRIKQLFEDFNADFCVLDTRTGGVNIYDALAKILFDEDRGVTYTPWTCMNDQTLKDRVKIAGQKEVIFSIQASATLNSEIAVCMRNTLNNKMIDFLVDYQDGVEELFSFIPGYEAMSVDEQVFYERPFLEIRAMVNEMINLEYQVLPQTGLVRIEEKSGQRKDRYTSVSYGNYFAEMLEKDLFNDRSDYEFMAIVD